MREKLGRKLLTLALAGAAISGYALHFLPPRAAQASVQTSGLTREVLGARADTPSDVLIKSCGGELVLIGTIVATTGGVTNTSTGAPFAVPEKQQLCIQCDAAAALAGGAVGTWGGTVTATMAQANTGVRVAAFDMFPWSPQAGSGCTSSQACLGAASVANTSNCSVFKAL